MTEPTPAPDSTEVPLPNSLDEAAVRQDVRLDEALDETFPASDPVSFSNID